MGLLGAGAAHSGRVHPGDGAGRRFSTSGSENLRPRAAVDPTALFLTYPLSSPAALGGRFTDPGNRPSLAAILTGRHTP